MLKSFSSRLGFALVFAAGALLAQNPAAAPQFEVASIKPAPPIDRMKIMSGQMHIGMTIDAGRVNIGNLGLADLIRIAYRLKPYQLSGPDWMTSQRFDVLAKIPEGVSKDLVPEMLQALLVERFKMTFHRDTKEQPVYALVVGKNGPKLKEAAPDTDAPAADGPAQVGGRAGMIFGTGPNQVRVNQNGDGRGATVTGGPMGQMKMVMGEGGAMRMEFGKMTMPMLAEMLTRFTDKPVLDMTELKGNYQVALELSMEEMRNVARASAMSAGIMLGGPGPGGDTPRTPADAASTPSGSSIFGAVEKLGLKLDSRKMPVETIVIDHLEKTPTEN